MRLLRYFCGLCALAALAILVHRPAPAASAAPIPGTIYFGWNGRLNTMNADGTGKTALPAGVFGHLSQGLHGGRRWLVIWRSGQLLALRDDGLVTATLVDPLQSGLTVQIAGPWAKDNPGTTGVNEADGFVSFLGQDSVGNRAVYRLEVTFGSDGVPAASGAPQLRLVAGRGPPGL